MRAFLSILLLALAFWRAVVDWRATIGHGVAYRPGSIGGLIADHWPHQYASLVDSLERSGVPYAWNPVGAFVMSLPLALVLAAIALGIWITRERSPAGRRVR